MLLRILTLPVAMSAFAVLYVTANKLPHIIESTDTVVWIVLSVLLPIRLFHRR